MKTSVVIPAFNGKTFFEKNLKYVRDMGVDEIVIIDDASTDGTFEYLSELKDIKLVKHAKNVGFTKTVNDGFAIATGDVVFLLNQDLKPLPKLVTNSLRHFANKEVFAVTFNEGQRSWADGKWIDGMLEFKNGTLDNQIHESLWPSGGSSAIRRGYWNKLGGFDTIFSPGYYEDLDLGLRASKAGYKIIWDPDCKVDHQTEGSFPKRFSAKKLLLIKERNYLIAVWKNIDKNMWAKHLASLVKRVVGGPGYIVPIFMALSKIICC